MAACEIYLRFDALFVAAVGDGAARAFCGPAYWTARVQRLSRGAGLAAVGNAVLAALAATSRPPGVAPGGDVADLRAQALGFKSWVQFAQGALCVLGAEAGQGAIILVPHQGDKRGDFAPLPAQALRASLRAGDVGKAVLDALALCV